MRKGCWRAWAAVAERSISVTLPLSVLALAIWLAPGAAEWLQFDPVRVISGELWRAFTCHLTHWSPSHLLWDVAALALLGRMCERRSPERLLACLASAAIVIPAAVGLFHPGMLYRGLSGLDSALFALLAMLLLREKAAGGDLAGMALAVLMMAGFGGKIAYEFVTADALFAGGADMVPVPLAHAVGAVVGIASGLPGAGTIQRGLTCLRLKLRSYGGAKPGGYG